jgi:glucosamine--fructose-6-phosphate aminotransferase (isomerizing)
VVSSSELDPKNDQPCINRQADGEKPAAGQYYTYQEIDSQPHVWRATLQTFTAQQRALSAFLQQYCCDHILAVGCGSSYYLAQTAATILTHCAGLAAAALPSSEFWLFPRLLPQDQASLLLTLSRSGATTETLWAVQRFRATRDGPVMAITCNPESQLAEQADFVLQAPIARERSVVQTRSLTSMLLLILCLTTVLSAKQICLANLRRLPELLESLLVRLGDLPRHLGEDLSIQRFVFLGNGALYGLANELMLKTQEMSRSQSEAYHTLDFRHGPMSLVDDHTLVVGLLSDTGLEQELRVLEEMSALGASTLAMLDSESVLQRWRPDHVVTFGSGLTEWERGPLYLPAIQNLAYHRALVKGLNPDRPLHLRAVVELAARAQGVICG